MHREIFVQNFSEEKSILYPREIVPFYIRNPFKIHLEQFQTKIEIALNLFSEILSKLIGPTIEPTFSFTKEIPIKMDRTKKKVHQKIELIFSFTKEIPLKNIRNKKKPTMKFGLKNTV